MGQKIPLKDFYSRIIGYIEEKPNGDKIGYDFYNRIVGYYRKDLNVTQDYYRRIVARGDMLSGLVLQAEGNVKR